jgi:hypothetical protein
MSEETSEPLRGVHLGEKDALSHADSCARQGRGDRGSPHAAFSSNEKKSVVE